MRKQVLEKLAVVIQNILAFCQNLQSLVSSNYQNNED